MTEHHDHTHTMLRADLLRVIEETLEHVARSTEFGWSTWLDRDEATATLRHAMQDIAAGGLPSEVHTWFLPTGNLQEISLASGWASEYLVLSERLDRLWSAIASARAN